MIEDNTEIQNKDVAKSKILVTSALPYANGSIHMGHLVEYIQTDIFVRSQKIRGEDIIYCCADDTHGTPISISAEKQGISPEDFIKKFNLEHQKDFKNFLIEFDSYYSTNSIENKEFSDLIYSRLKEKGDIYEKELELTYCENCNRFLPDRYVKGSCPKCGAQDQYGDVCEKCNAAYDTIDLVEPYCVICKKKPVRKKSNHFFFKLSEYSTWLKEWLTNNENIQSEVKNQVLNWIENGLRDWCISRDGPYFGFKIPDSDKYYYVWLDAPIGYISSTKNYCDNVSDDKDLTVEDYWGVNNGGNANSKIIHVIGKDIIYFHLLFWPSMLKGAQIKVPDDVVVHGFLTVNKEKMSKSRGTFLSAKQVYGAINPEHLRFYYAMNLSKTMSDLDLDLNEFKNRINGELVSNIANFFYRSISFLYKNFDGLTVDSDESVVYEARKLYEDIFSSYKKYDFRKVVSLSLKLSSLGNSYMQVNEPWKLIKTDEKKAQEILSTCVEIAKYLAICLKPILPNYILEIEKELGIQNLDINNINQKIKKVNEPKIYFTKIEDLKLGKEIFDLDLRVAKIEKVEQHPNADKLYIEHLDLGNGEKRQIVSGLVPYYKPEELVDKKIVVVCNLETAKLRGVESQGMLLAGEDSEGKVGVLFVENALVGTKVLPKGYEASSEIIDFKQFLKIKLNVIDSVVYFDDKELFADDESVKVERVINGNVS